LNKAKKEKGATLFFFCADKKSHPVGKALPPSEILAVLLGTVLPLREFAFSQIAAFFLAAASHRVKQRRLFFLFHTITSVITMPCLTAGHVTFSSAGSSDSQLKLHNKV